MVLFRPCAKHIVFFSPRLVFAQAVIESYSCLYLLNCLVHNKCSRLFFLLRFLFIQKELCSEKHLNSAILGHLLKHTLGLNKLEEGSNSVQNSTDSSPIYSIDSVCVEYKRKNRQISHCVLV